jgi:hypothetical protein
LLRGAQAHGLGAPEGDCRGPVPLAGAL